LQAWPDLEAQVKVRAQYGIGEVDFASVLAKLKAANSQIIFVAGGPEGLANLVRQARSAGSRALFVAANAAASPTVRERAQDAAEGLLFTFFPDLSRMPAAAPVVARMRDKARGPSVYGLYAYLAIQIWAQAATSAGSVKAAPVSTSLHQRPFEGLPGPISFDEKGDVRQLDYVFYQWQDGRPQQMNNRPPPPPPPPPK
jgi:branched-chain amino acid transport system substrate-binding protein